jgi:hypothetical protein
MADRPTDEELRAELEALVLEEQLVASVQRITATMRPMADTLAKLLEVAQLQQTRLDRLEDRLRCAELRLRGVNHG